MKDMETIRMCLVDNEPILADFCGNIYNELAGNIRMSVT